MAYIYKIINDVNQKVYIGKTEFSLEKRFQEHCNDAFKESQEKRPLYAAMRKYGINNFHIELIEETFMPEEREKYWIQYYGSFKNGYNATLGGDGKKYIDYDLVIATYKQNNNAAKTARILNISSDSVRNIVKQYGLNPSNGGKNYKPVAQLDKNTGEIIAVFASATEAEKTLHITKHINAVCKGNRKTAGGYGWKYI